MTRLCNSVNQSEEMIFWIRELTQVSNQQAEVTLKQLRRHQESEYPKSA
ncbi:hypothetical protein [Lyngbya confervoides]|uniref:Uncharacterized protein n=1 Tax=Lyngbya confervoides BDU141951 TaxID=1574623 RepID=A0ABD4T2D6_9CYAN|nr:hypothetical protein [Lyngbya confervoides]MCM1982556.1 hypothetical protein [Lyngbya confervoides BDU141951]